MSVDGRIAAFTLLELDKIDSTNSEAMRRAARGERGPLCIVAHTQTAGKGRSGRGWVTSSGNLAATLLFAPRCPTSVLPQLSIVAGVAVFDAVASSWPPGEAAAAGLRLKWPNDLMIGAAKLGGILVETTTMSDALLVSIGIGINIAHAPAVSGRRIACLAQHRTILPMPREVARLVLHHFIHWFGVWDSGGNFRAIRAAWLERAGPLGEAMTINSGAGPIAGVFAGLDTDGALLLCDDAGQRQRFTFGDVSLESTIGTSAE